MVITIPFRIIFNALLLLRYLVEWLLLWPVVLVRRRARRFVRIDIRGRFELAQPRGWSFRRRTGTTYENLEKVLSRLERERGMEGVLVRLSNPHLDLASAILVRNRLARARAHGKRVVCHLDSGGPLELVIAGAADKVFMSPGGDISLFGLKSEMSFFRDLLAHLGFKGQFYHIGRYKTAGHPFSRSGSTSAQKTMMRSLLTSIDESLQSLIPLALKPTYTAVEARQARLIHHQAYFDQVMIRLRAEGADPDDAWDPLGDYGDKALRSELQKKLKRYRPLSIYMAPRYTSLRPHPLAPHLTLRMRPEVAVVVLSGILTSDGPTPAPFGRRPVIDPDTVDTLLKQVADNPRIRAVVLSINSRGGTIVASDLVWRAVWRLRQKKPVIASLGSIAASGGYHIALPATEIMAYPTTVTGSIGVLTGKISAAQGLTKAGIRMETMVKGPFATMPSMWHPFTRSQLEPIRSTTRNAYRRFVNRVAIGRGLTGKKVHRIARGRVYTGNQALRLGLIDRVGSLDDAIHRAFELAKVSPDLARVRYYTPKKPGLFGILPSLMDRQRSGSESLPSWLDEALDFCRLLEKPRLLAYYDGRLSID